MTLTQRNRNLEAWLRRLRIPSALTLVLLFAGLCSSASGDQLLPASYQAVVRGNPNVPDAPGTYVGASCDSITCQSSTVTMLYGTGLHVGNGFADAEGRASQSSHFTYAAAEATVQYYFGVFGPFNGEVPLVFSGTAESAEGVFQEKDGSASAGGYIKIFNGNSRTSTFNFCDTSAPNPNAIIITVPCAYDRGTSWTAQVLVTPNPSESELGSITLFAAGFAIGGNFIAEIDPTLTFAPGFDHTGLTLEFSPNPISTSTVPEPGSLLLLGSVIAGLISVSQWKRHHGKTFREWPYLKTMHRCTARGWRRHVPHGA